MGKAAKISRIVPSSCTKHAFRIHQAGGLLLNPRFSVLPPFSLVFGLLLMGAAISVWSGIHSVPSGRVWQATEPSSWRRPIILGFSSLLSSWLRHLQSATHPTAPASPASVLRRMTHRPLTSAPCRPGDPLPDFPTVAELVCLLISETSTADPPVARHGRQCCGRSHWCPGRLLPAFHGEQAQRG